MDHVIPPRSLNRAALMTKKNCLICSNIVIGDDFMQCRVYGERILMPAAAAEDCPSFEESFPASDEEPHA
jgi:hypothetical protein